MKIVCSKAVRLLLHALCLSALVPLSSLAVMVVTPSSETILVNSSHTFKAARNGQALSAATWSVNGTVGGNAASGTITPAGVYTAPQVVPATNPVSISATSTGPADSGTASVMIHSATPTLSSVSPSGVAAGSYALTVTGTNFLAGAQVFVNSQSVSTQFISSSQLNATGTASQPGTLTLAVANPGPVLSTTTLQVQVSAASAPPSPPLPAPAPPANPQVIAAARFLEQATFGPTPADISSVMQNGEAAWIANQLSLPASALNAATNMSALRNNWYLNMARGPDQLRQRVIFALSQIMVVSDLKNTNADEVLPWLQTLSTNAFGNYQTLLRQMTLNPAMGKYLDLGNSVTPTPNENYAREVMQLFSIGVVMLNEDGSVQLDSSGNPIPTYTQATVTDMARALSGWTYAPAATSGSPTGLNWENFTGPLQPRDNYHDHGPKVLLQGYALPAKQNILQDYDAVMNSIFLHPNLPPFIATRLIRALVSSNPSPAYIKRVADVFLNNGQGVRGDLGATLTAILLDPEARQDTPSATQGKLKDAVLHTMGLFRALNATFIDPTNMFWDYYLLGERLLDSPSVFNFYSPLTHLPGNARGFGPEFQIYSPGLALMRANFVYALLTGQYSTIVKINLAPFVTAASSPNTLINLVDATLLQGRMSATTRAAIATALATPSDNTTNAITALYLAAVTADFAVHN